MQEEEIINRIIDFNPSEVVFSITCRSILSAIVHRMGIQALALSPEDLQLACEEVRAVLDHNLDERECLELALDNWEVIRNI